MKKLLTALILTTSISGFAHQGHDGEPGHSHGSGVNVTASPTINFNPVINVNPNITSDNKNINRNTNTIKNELKLDKLHGEKSTPEVKNALKKLQDIDNHLTKLEKKEFNYEDLKKNFGKESASQGLLAKVSADIKKEREKLLAESKKIMRSVKHMEKSKKGVVLFKFKNLKTMWSRWIKENNPLVPKLIELSLFTKKEFGKPLVITHMERTQAQQNKMYGNKRGKRSWHQFSAAADIRSRIYSPREIVQIVRFLKKHEKTNAIKKLTVLFHDIGLASHIHFQFRNAGQPIKLVK